MDDSKIFIVGANGQLGTALQAKYPKARKADISELDITDKKSVDSFDWNGIEIIINAAAYTNVDGAETPEGRVTAWKVNACAVAYLADIARKYDMTLVHISTDYVFDGTKKEHTETEDFSPISVYGSTKAAGDIAASSNVKHYILRTSWVIGEGKNFVRTMLDLGAKGISPTVVHDQIGRLTFTPIIVEAIATLIEKQSEYGTYNVTNTGDPVSWADITREIFKAAGYNLNVGNTTTKEYFAGKESIAPRPLNSVLDLSKIEAIGYKPSDWHTDLANYIKKETAQL